MTFLKIANLDSITSLFFGDTKRQRRDRGGRSAWRVYMLPCCAQLATTQDHRCQSPREWTRSTSNMAPNAWTWSIRLFGQCQQSKVHAPRAKSRLAEEANYPVGEIRRGAHRPVAYARMDRPSKCQKPCCTNETDWWHGSWSGQLLCCVTKKMAQNRMSTSSSTTTTTTTATWEWQWQQDFLKNKGIERLNLKSY